MENITQVLTHYKESIGLIISWLWWAVTHILNRVRKWEKVSVTQSFAHIFSSWFMGLMVYFICKEVWIEWGYMGFMVWMSGYAWAKILDIIDSISPKAVADILLDFIRYKIWKK